MVVLIVDDEPGIRAVIREYVEFEGHEADEAVDGMDAVQKCREREYDVVVMDAMMPRLDGLSACKQIRKERDVPVLMLSARGEEYDKLFGFEMGVGDYVVKPFSPKELIARLNVIAGRHAQRRAEPPDGALAFGGLRIDTLRGVGYKFEACHARHGRQTVPVFHAVRGADTVPAVAAADGISAEPVRRHDDPQAGERRGRTGSRARPVGLRGAARQGGVRQRHIGARDRRARKRFIQRGRAHDGAGEGRDEGEGWVRGAAAAHGLSAVRLGAGGARVEVGDRGQGIAEDDLPHIWERYYKAKDHVRGAAGTGLGLSIVRSILKQHGARFGADSRVGEGSTFWFELGEG